METIVRRIGLVAHDAMKKDIAGRESMCLFV